MSMGPALTTPLTAAASNPSEPSDRLPPPFLSADLDEQPDDVEDDDEMISDEPEEQLRSDMFGSPFVRLVHTNGIHYICLVTCECNQRTSHIDMMYAGFMPTTFAQYRTVFSTAVLDDYQLSNLECKSSISQYWQKLCRQTDSSQHPGHMKSLKRELGRLSRLWRWTKKSNGQVTATTRKIR